jgi:hypothetical protein
MIADDAFLRRLPTVFDGAQSVQIEALVFSADAIDANFATIKRITAACGKDICSAPRHVHVDLFTRTWAIVDCLHVVREILEALDYQTPLAIAFLEKYEAASKLRNLMDHLKNNARNVANAKHRPPIFGVLGYIYVSNENIVMKDGQLTVTGGATVMLSAGRFLGGRQMTAVNPADLPELRGPVCGFRLEAFDKFLQLEQADHDLRALMAEVNDRLEKDIVERAVTLSKERSIPVEKLLANPAGGLCLFLAFKTGDAA